jgi:seryl-tRNA synthetase
MLNIRRLREDFNEIKTAIEKRGEGDFGLPVVLDIDKKRRTLLLEVETLKNKQKISSKQIPVLKKDGKSTDELMTELKELSNKISDLDSKISIVENGLREKLLFIPNTPLPDVPVGKDELSNVEIKKVGKPMKKDFNIKPHWEIGVELDILDFERAAKIAGARFSLYKNFGAKLERAITNFMLDIHAEKHGYTEILPPFMVNDFAMTGTGQLPKFKDDMYKLDGLDFYLVPTAEVPLTNLHANEILSSDELPLYYTAYTPCFRKEAGSAGRDTKGLIRVHQFNKVELVKFTKPEDSEKELESLLAAAEEILKLLEIPYRTVLLSTGDLGFSSAKTYDIEVWMPSYNRYVEISSCSNFLDFQARRANIKFRRASTAKAEFFHTLNGSGLAVGRTTAAILENYQREDGTIEIPKILKPYL